MLNKLRNAPDARALAALALLVVLFLAPGIFTGKVLFPADALYAYLPWSAFGESMGVGAPHNELLSDQALQNYQWRELVKQSLGRGELPLWNPYIFSGMPFLATGQAGVLYPLSVIFLVLPTLPAYLWFYALHLFLAGAGMYLYLRSIDTGRWGAFIGATAFMFSAVFVTTVQWPQMTSAMTWLPWLLLTLEHFLRELERPETLPEPVEGTVGDVGQRPRSRRQTRLLFWTGLAAIFLAMELLSGHLEISFYILLLLAAYVIVRLWRPALPQDPFPLGWGKARMGVPPPHQAPLTSEASQTSPRSASIGSIVIGVGVALILGFALAGAQLLPFAEVIRQNVRAGGSSFSDVPQWALPAKQLVALIIPDFFGNPTHHTFFDIISGQWASFAGSMDAAGQPRTYPFWGARNYVEAASYIGVLPLVLAIVALVRRSDRHSAFFGVYGLVALLMALGTPLYALIYFLVPGAEQLHSPFRWLFPLTFCLTVLAGRGADVLIRHAGTRLYRFGEVVGATLMVLGATILGALLISWLASGLTLSGVTLIRNMSAALQAAFPTVESLYSYELRNIALFGVLLAVSGATLSIALRPSPPLTRRPGEPPSETGGRASRSGPALLVGVVFVDLALFGWGYLPFSDAKLATFVPPSLQWLQERQREEGPFRIASFGTSKVLPPNTAMLAGLQDIRGYDSIIPKQYVEYWRLMEEPQTLQYTQIDAIREGGSLESPLFDLMNVRYIVADQVIATPGFTLVYQQEVYIYRNDNALPRAYIALNAISAATDAVARESLTSPDFNPRNAVVLQGANPAAKADVQPDTSPLPLGDAQGEGSTPIILDYTSNKVRIQANLSEPGYLVLSDAYFDGWQAFDASGNALPVLKANGAFRAVALPAGEHTVTFSYSPLSVRFGFLLSLLGVVGWLLLAGYWGWLHFRIERTSAVTVQRVVKNSVTPMAAQMLGRVVDLGFAVVMLRILGPTSYGAYAFAVVLIGYFGIMSDFGLGTLLTREVARDPSRVGAYLGNTLLVRGTLTLLSAPVLLGLLAVYYTYFSLPLEAVFATGLFFLSLVPSGIAGVLSAVFSAHEKMEYAAAMTIVTTLVRVAVGIVALAVGWGVVGLGVASLVASSTNAVAFVWLARHNFDLPQLRVELPFARSLLATSAPLMINNLLNTIFFRVDVLFLQSFLGTQAVGYYSTAYKFVDGLLLIPSFFTLALFPVFSRFAENSPDRLLYVYSTSVKGLLIIALPIALALTFLAEPLVALLFGPDYAPSARALQIVIWFLPFSYINGVTQYVLISLNQQRYLTGAFFIGTMFNVVANIVVIPTHGINGAALVTVLSEIVLLAPFMYGIHRHLGVGPLGQAAVRPFIAAAIVLLGLMAFQGQSPWVLAALGIGVYGTLLLVLGTFGKEDRALLGRLFARSGAAERIG